MSEEEPSIEQVDETPNENHGAWYTQGTISWKGRKHFWKDSYPNG